MAHYIVDAYLDFRTISKEFRSLWHFGASMVSCSHAFRLIMEITVPALIANSIYYKGGKKIPSPNFLQYFEEKVQDINKKKK